MQVVKFWRYVEKRLTREKSVGIMISIFFINAVMELLKIRLSLTES